MAEHLRVLTKGAHQVGIRERRVPGRHRGLGKGLGKAEFHLCSDLPPWLLSSSGDCHWVSSLSVTWQDHRQNYYRNSLFFVALPWIFQPLLGKTFSRWLLISDTQCKCQMHMPWDGPAVVSHHAFHAPWHSQDFCSVRPSVISWVLDCLRVSVFLEGVLKAYPLGQHKGIFLYYRFIV